VFLPVGVFVKSRKSAVFGKKNTKRRNNIKEKLVKRLIFCSTWSNVWGLLQSGGQQTFAK